MFLFHERFIEHKINQFIDLCSVSNVCVTFPYHIPHTSIIHVLIDQCVYHVASLLWLLY